MHSARIYEGVQSSTSNNISFIVCDVEKNKRAKREHKKWGVGGSCHFVWK
ncbi:23S rRNA C2498 (ribose-2'-O)-methylase RlmM [Pseudoteredinibacter isoporae]|uniref:23S rRNA C2498 (Ribose-2'-O)-methylase RlmM n=1 Tax=Pseudoteredinibacter isoporae TaxID=570281 RepID=A0A7X0JWC5_9GAMM|nr:23S rRNA C2498 (ribose-2'-O)-methylase RlmM [Pseudoteredinibacter isoporae]